MTIVTGACDDGGDDEYVIDCYTTCNYATRTAQTMLKNVRRKYIRPCCHGRNDALERINIGWPRALLPATTSDIMSPTAQACTMPASAWARAGNWNPEGKQSWQILITRNKSRYRRSVNALTGLNREEAELPRRGIQKGNTHIQHISRRTR